MFVPTIAVMNRFVPTFAALLAALLGLAGTAHASTAVPASEATDADVASSRTAPLAAFTTVVNNRRTSFDALGSTDPDGDAIVRYDWDFGDGTSAPNGGAQITNRYGKGRKQFPVTLTVTDETGASSTLTQTPFAPTFLGDDEQPAARTLRLRLVCPADCQVKVVGRLKLSGKGVDGKKAQLQGATKTLRAGRAGTLKLKLTQRGVEQAGVAKNAIARLKVSVTDDAGNLFKDRHGIRVLPKR